MERRKGRGEIGISLSPFPFASSFFILLCLLHMFLLLSFKYYKLCVCALTGKWSWNTRGTQTIGRSTSSSRKKTRSRSTDTQWHRARTAFEVESDSRVVYMSGNSTGRPVNAGHTPLLVLPLWPLLFILLAISRWWAVMINPGAGTLDATNFITIQRIRPV